MARLAKIPLDCHFRPATFSMMNANGLAWAMSLEAAIMR
jgi:hypothetical protein